MGPGNKPNILQLIAGAEPLGAMRRAYDSAGRTVLLRDMVGGALSVYAAALIARTGGTHVFVAEDRDAAAYLLNDFYALLDEKQVYFFPGSYKRSIVYGTEDAQGVVQRTAALSALRREMAAGEYRIICTYPEALAERVTDPDSMRRETVRVKVGDRLAIGELEELLADSGFTKVDFVYEPGQYSLRGGIFDVFSFSESKPYRLDFFGEEVDSIRRFEISSQLSADRLNEVEIVPNLNGFAGDRISLLAFAGEATYWFFDPDYVLRRVNDLRRKVLGEMEEPAEIDTHLVSRKVLLQDMAGMRLFELRDSLKERPADATVAFRMAPQPKFNKNFELLADDIISNGQRGYKTYILSENRAQLERLENIFYQSGRKEAQINPLPITLHEGFVDHDLKLCFYTDHQIFDRYQRYRINGEIKRDEQMTVAELNQLRMGDYVVHIDHGVGRFGGLVKINENGKVHEAIKLIYKDNDVLFVHVHALHRISRYKSGEGEAPKIYKLGSGAWQKLKTATKKAVKDISRELIALYAKRKASKGFAFSPDTYLQQELEASFMWEDTPDQQTATQAVKRDMESNQPMDRLICGDVGFGKTEVALRAAFKCIENGKQAAILTPTTLLAWQHYNTIRARFEGFPVTVELLSRFRTPQQQEKILRRLRRGEIDLLVGTHRLIQKDVVFKDLGLLIVDEEQRFGVSHKEALKEMTREVDVLTLSATPIPRTLNMALSGIRDMSTLDTPPSDRHPVATYVCEYSDDLIADAIRRELGRGGQVYYLHNRVESIYKVADRLARLFPQAEVDVAHGKMSKEELSEVWERMTEGETSILVCTTIIETGVDVPDANTLIIEDADRLGLAQLHQIRGRVGRSYRKAYAYFTYRAGRVLTEDGRKRLDAIREYTEFGSGFRIAMRDLQIRGAGDLLGAAQSGHMDSVGYDLYMQLLNEAISEKRGEAPAPRPRDCLVDLKVSAYLPQSYVESEAARVDLYKKIAAVETEEDCSDLLDEMIERFGDPPREVLALIDLSLIRTRCAKAGIREISFQNNQIRLKFEKPDMEKIAALISRFPGKMFFSAGSEPYIAAVSSRPVLEAASEIAANLE